MVREKEVRVVHLQAKEYPGIKCPCVSKVVKGWVALRDQNCLVFSGVRVGSVAIRGYGG